MSTAIFSRINQKCLKKFCAMKISVNFLSNTEKVYAKKRFGIKNKFTFQDEIRQKQSDTVYSESRTFSPDLLSRENISKLEFDNLNDSSNIFVSSDLLLRNTIDRRQNTKKPLERSNSKPLLTYKGEILFGVHPVYLALLQKKRIFHHLYIRKDIDSSDEDDSSVRAKIVSLANSMDIPVSYVDSRGLKILAPGAVHQGVCLDAGFLPLHTWNENQSENYIAEKNPLWLILDEILDPMNVGAVIRSSYYFGVNKIFTVKGNSCKLSPTVSKASSGSLEVMDIYQIANLENFIKERKENGWYIVSTLAYSENKSDFNKSAVSATKFKTSNPTILILGNEGRGISETILKLCDSLISIEPGQNLSEGIDSLNVSVAAGVILHALNSQRM